MKSEFWFSSRRWAKALLLLGIISLLPRGGDCGEPTLKKTVLANGLTVILREIHTAPVVALQAWVKVGGADEKDDEAGITHLIEHMLFKGTAKRRMGEIAWEVENAGGEINAWTSHDETVFHLVIPSRYFAEGLDIMADAVQHSAFDSRELEREKEVVGEEIRMRADQPTTVLMETLFANAYKVHPYRREVIGFQETVRAFTREKVLAYYQKWYTLDNITLVVTGDFQQEEALQAVQSAFARDRSPAKERDFRRPQEPPQRDFRGVVLRKQVQKAYLDMAFHIPSITHGDVYSLDVLASLLGQGDSSRLYQKIKQEKGLAYSIGAYSFTPQDPGVFMLNGVMEGEKAQAAVTAIMEEIYRLQVDPPSQNELERAKLNLASDFVYQKETVQGEARQLGYFETVLGDVAYEQTYLNRLSQVTASDVMRVAREYLTSQNLTAALLVPEKEALELSADALKQAVLQASPPPGPEREETSAKTVKHVLSNGSILLVRENHRLPVVSMQAAFLGGVRVETASTNGLTNFVAAMLTKGTPQRTALQIAEDIEDMAGSLEGFSGRNSFGVSCTVLSQFFDQGATLFAEVLLQPRFPAEEMEKKRQELLAALDQKQDQPVSYTLTTFDRLFFASHPYGMDPLGTKETVRSFAARDLQEWYARLARPGHLVLAVVGDVDQELVREKMERLFQGFSGTTPDVAKVEKQAPPERPRKQEIRKGSRAQAQIMWGFPGVDLKDEDKYPLKVLNAILAGQGGRLFTELRDKESLAYVVTSFAWEGIDPGYIAFYLGCAPGKKDKALEGIAREVKKVVENKVSPAELQRAQNYLVGDFAIGHQTNQSWASELALNELYGLGYDYSAAFVDKILQVNAQEVQRVAGKYLDLEHSTLLVVQPEEATRAQ